MREEIAHVNSMTPEEILGILKDDTSICKIMYLANFLISLRKSGNSKINDIFNLFIKDDCGLRVIHKISQLCIKNSIEVFDENQLMLIDEMIGPVKIPEVLLSHGDYL